MRAVGRERKPLIFVVGNSRSGTTMMGRILNGHPSVFTFGELHFFEQLWAPEDRERQLFRVAATQLMARLLSIQRQGYLGRGDPELFRAEAEEAISFAPPGPPSPAEVFETFLLYEAARNGKEIPCDQTPRNVFYVGEILELYPEARVVNMVRDPRDVLLSQKGKWKRRFLGAGDIPLTEAVRSWINYHPVTISKLWSASVSAADRYEDEQRVLSVRFEDLLADPEAAIREVCELTGVSFDRALLEVPQVGSSSGRDRPDRRRIDRARAGSWQREGLSPTEVFLCQKVAGPLMKRHGYPLSPTSPNLLRLAWSAFSLPVKLLLALLFNLKRMRNIRETIKRRMA